MNRYPDFKTQTRRLASWFRKKLNEDQVDIMYNKLKFIPGPAYEDIIDSIIEGSKWFPTIVEIRNRYNAWRSAHPERCADFDRTVCLDCHSKGFLWYDVVEKGIAYNVVARCGACENWKGEASTEMPVRHRANLERDGIKVTFPKHRAENAEALRPMKTNRHLKLVHSETKEG